MFGEMLDTTPEARAFYFARLAAMTSTERLSLAFSQTRMVRRVAEASLRKQHPGASEVELRARLAVRLYGREIVSRVLSDIPDDAQ